MAYFVVLERADVPKVIAVNPDQVQSVCPHDETTSCYLHLAGDQVKYEPVSVKGTLEQVLHKLRECGS